MLKQIYKLGELEIYKKYKEKQLQEHKLIDLFWECTLTCNAKCKHCGSSAEKRKYEGELTTEEIKKAFKQISQDMDATKIWIDVTGGEPLMYDRLPELVELTSKLGMKSTIYTFAYRTDETLNKYRQLIDLGLNKIVYSLADSLSDEEDISVYDKVEFFDKVVKIDDPVGAISVHGVCGALGTLFTGIFGEGCSFITQLIGFVAVAAYTLILAFILFFVLKKTIGLRVTEKEEIDGLDMHEHGCSAYANFHFHNDK